MTALIIEDEIPAGKRLEKLLVQKGFTVLSIVVSVKNAVKWFQQNSQPEFVFIDIKLRDGNSFEILEKVEVHSKIIFTTAYDEFALKAFDYNAIDYLLKPIDEKKLDKMIFKLNSLSDFIPKNDFQSSTENFKSSFLIAVGNSLKKIETHEIQFFFSENNATFISTNNGRFFPVNTSLEKLEQDLDATTFFRISRKHIINRNYITTIYSKNQIYVSIEKNEIDLKVSRLKSKLFIKWYKKTP